MGDYAFPCFKLSKALRMGPPMIAKKLAESLDLGRSSLYRAMDALEADGILKKDKKLLTILDMDALERWSPKNN